jgi:exo-beta-1,3-glucanase (GH17 family)
LASWILTTDSLPHARANVLQDLATQRHWIGYAPRNFNPNAGIEPSQEQIRDDLEQLYAEGWRSLYTYSLDGVLQHVPRIAKEVGFDYTLAGVFFFDEVQITREKVAAQAELDYIDGFIVGNEGLIFGRYSPERLVEEVFYFQTLGKPVTTTEVSGVYLAFPQLLDLGDFAFYNTQPWFDDTLDPFDPVGMAEAVRDEYFALRELRPERTIVIKESWFPSAGHPAATEANQVAFFEALADATSDEGEPVLFAWGEAYDQPWKREQSPFGQLGPHWGFHTADGQPKQIISALQHVYTGPVPIIPEPATLQMLGLVVPVLLAARHRCNRRTS